MYNMSVLKKIIEAQEENETTEQSENCWERFNNWFHCICIVTFDLELGQALEVHILLATNNKHCFV